MAKYKPRREIACALAATNLSVAASLLRDAGEPDLAGQVEALWQQAADLSHQPRSRVIHTHGLSASCPDVRAGRWERCLGHEEEVAP